MSNKQQYFFITGFEGPQREEMRKSIEQLNGILLENMHNNKLLKSSCLISKQLYQTEKLLSALASGMWILTEDFIHVSMKNKKFVRKRDHEWTDKKRALLTDNRPTYMLDLPKHWRTVVAREKRRAFSDWHVVLLVKDRVKYERLLTIGGATVYSKDHLSDINASEKITHVFIDEYYFMDHREYVEKLIERGLSCYEPRYMGEVLQLAPSPKKFKISLNDEQPRSPSIERETLVDFESKTIDANIQSYLSVNLSSINSADIIKHLVKRCSVRLKRLSPERGQKSCKRSLPMNKLDQGTAKQTENNSNEFRKPSCVRLKRLRDDCCNKESIACKLPRVSNSESDVSIDELLPELPTASTYQPSFKYKQRDSSMSFPVDDRAALCFTASNSVSDILPKSEAACDEDSLSDCLDTRRVIGHVISIGNCLSPESSPLRPQTNPVTSVTDFHQRNSSRSSTLVPTELVPVKQICKSVMPHVTTNMIHGWFESDRPWTALNLLLSMVSRTCWPREETLKAAIEVLQKKDESLNLFVQTVLFMILEYLPPTTYQTLQLYMKCLDVDNTGDHLQNVIDLCSRLLNVDGHIVNSDIVLQRCYVKVIESDFQTYKTKIFTGVHGGNHKNKNVLGKTLNSSVVVLSTTLNSCGAIEEMILSMSNGLVSLTRCLLARCIWTNAYAAIRNERLHRILSCLVKCVKHRGNPYQMELTRMMINLLEMALWCCYWASGYRERPQSGVMPSKVRTFCNAVADCLSNDLTSDELGVIFSQFQDDWFSMNVCRMILDRFTTSSHLDADESQCLSLDVITNIYFRLHLIQVNRSSESVTPVKKYPVASPGFITPIHRSPTKKLLNATEVNKRNIKGETPLHVACRNNKLVKVRELLQMPGIDINAKDHAGWTPLHEACSEGHIQVVDELIRFKRQQKITDFLSNGIKSDLRLHIGISSEDGTTPLHDAVKSHHVDVAQLLLQHGGVSLLEAKDNSGKIPWDYAAKEDMKLLLLTEISNSGKTACPKTIQRSQSKPCPLKGIETISASSKVESSCESLELVTSKETCHMYVFLVTSLVKLYLNWRGIDVEEMKGFEVHVEEFKKHIVHLRRDDIEDGVLEKYLVQLDCLADTT